MILTIDVGNTNTVLGAFRDGNLINHWRVSTDKAKTPDEYGILFHNLFAFSRLGVEDITGIVISSVVPPIIRVLKKTTQRYFSREPLIIEPGLETGIRIIMDNPREVGADRIVNAVAAYRKFGGPLIIVDFGTATTFCAVSREGDYLGGAIVPGIGISTEALYKQAAKLPRIELTSPGKVLGKNTVEAMLSGIIYGTVGQVEGLIRRFKAEIGEEALVIATGGLVTLINAETESLDRIEPFLTLEGLYHLGILNGLRE